MPANLVSPPPLLPAGRRGVRLSVRDADGNPVAAPLPPEPTEDDLRRQELMRVNLLAAWEAERRRGRDERFLLLAALPSGLASTAIHLLLLIGLVVVAAQAPSLGAKVISVLVVASEQEDPQETPVEDFHVNIEPLPEDTMSAERPEEMLHAERVLENPDVLVRQDIGEMLSVLGPNPSRWSAEVARATTAPDPSSGLVGHRDAGGGLAARSQRRKQALSYGATTDSENAVDLALAWLARHQRLDGSWSFAHREGTHRCTPCLCGNPGAGGADNGATGMVLLAFLGAGHTHLHGSYRDEVAAGLRFLLSRQKNGDLRDNQGNLYSQGLATLALCEALAMTRYQYEKQIQPPPTLAAATKDREASDVFPPNPATESVVYDHKQLFRAAQQAVKFVQHAQHSAGGWRYSPKMPGDTSVVGWQLMALRSGYLAGLTIDPQTIVRADRFLDSVADDRIGSCYGYTRGQHAAELSEDAGIGATTPIGLLCRIYTGWRWDEPGMSMGIKRLSRSAQRDKGLYFYYYAAQVMHHYGGESWREWNAWMRDYLVHEQSRKGKERGSWMLDGPHDGAGRLYCTAMAAMTLEIYYRYSPVYTEEALVVGGLAETGDSAPAGIEEQTQSATTP